MCNQPNRRKPGGGVAETDQKHDRRRDLINTALAGLPRQNAPWKEPRNVITSKTPLATRWIPHKHRCRRGTVGSSTRLCSAGRCPSGSPSSSTDSIDELGK